LRERSGLEDAPVKMAKMAQEAHQDLVVRKGQLGREAVPVRADSLAEQRCVGRQDDRVHEAAKDVPDAMELTARWETCDRWYARYLTAYCLPDYSDNRRT